MSRRTIALAAMTGAALVAAWVGGLFAVLRDTSIRPATHDPAWDSSSPSAGMSPDPVPDSTDPATFGRAVASVLWSSRTAERDETAYRVMVRTDPQLGDPASAELADAIDHILTTGHNQPVVSVTVAPADGLTDITAVRVTGNDDAMTLRMRCRPGCRLVGITP